RLNVLGTLIGCLKLDSRLQVFLALRTFNSTVDCSLLCQLLLIMLYFAVYFGQRLRNNQKLTIFIIEMAYVYIYPGRFACFLFDFEPIFGDLIWNCHIIPI